MSLPKPEMKQIPYSRTGLNQFRDSLRSDIEENPESRSRYLLSYPTVYIAHQQNNAGNFNVYVGETSDIEARTTQHLTTDSKSRDDWKQLADDESAQLIVIGHPHFNKSLTLDVENRLMQYLSSVEAVDQLNNRRGNAQNQYYTQDEFDQIFRQIWKRLRKHDKRLFPTEQIVKDSALFKASPFHKLNSEQLEAKEKIYETILSSLQSGQTGQLVMVQGAAGTGKTVLLSSLFFELFQGASDSTNIFDFQDLDAYLLVNHNEQLTVYENLANKLGISRKNEKRVGKPTWFINNHSPEHPVDVILVDEAHLLWTQGKQSYRGVNQLADLIERAKVVVAVFDPAQVLNTNQYWEEAAMAWLDSKTQSFIELELQMRIDASQATTNWIRSLIDKHEILTIPDDDTYDLRIYDDPTRMYQDIKKLAGDDSNGLSRILATFDWPYNNAVLPLDAPTWNVTIEDLSLPWNLQTKLSRTATRKYRGLSWAERDYTINEVGSTYTIQGFDLNYAGVIIGESVKYRSGHVVFDPRGSANKNATQFRTMRNGTKLCLAEELLEHELNVLLTRGVHGLFIYAVDPALREALLEAQIKRTQHATCF